MSANTETLKTREIHGVPVNIERPAGTHYYHPLYRHEAPMVFEHDYGHIPNTMQPDGGDLDALVGPHEDSKTVFLIEKPKAKDPRQHDEFKVMLGFHSQDNVREVWNKLYTKPNLQNPPMTTLHMDEFKKLLRNPDLSAFKKLGSIHALQDLGLTSCPPPFQPSAPTPN